MVAPRERWCLVTIADASGMALASWELGGPGPPDLAAVEQVARLFLMAARMGARVSLEEMSPRLAELLDLAGLVVEMQGQAEARKEPLVVEEVQEEVHPGDLPG